MPAARLHYELSQKLRCLRVSLGMTTYALAEATGMSQSKIVKLENASAFPKPADVYRIGLALQLQPEIRESLVDDARHVRLARLKTNVRQSAARWKDYSRTQGECFEAECDATIVRSSQWLAIPALLETLEHTELFYERLAIQCPRAEFLQMRMRRQAEIYGGRRTYRFVIDEAVLSRPVLPLPLWIEQLHEVRKHVRRSVAEIGIIPLGTELLVPSESRMTFDNDFILSDLGGIGISRVEFQNKAEEVDMRVAQFEELSTVAAWERDAYELVEDAIKRFETIDLRENDRRADSGRPTHQRSSSQPG